MKNQKRWIFSAIVLLSAVGALYFLTPNKNQNIREIEKLTGLSLPSSSTMKFSEDNWDGHAFYVLQLPNMVDFIAENRRWMEPYKNHGYLERYVQNLELLPSVGDSLLSFSSHGSGNKWLAIVGSDSKLMWLSLHYMDHSGDAPW